MWKITDHLLRVGVNQPAMQVVRVRVTVNRPVSQVIRVWVCHTWVVVTVWLSWIRVRVLYFESVMDNHPPYFPLYPICFPFLIILNLWKSDFFQSHSFGQLTKQTRNCQMIFLQWTLVRREWARAVYPRPVSNVDFCSFDFICYLYFTWVNNKP